MCTSIAVYCFFACKICDFGKKPVILEKLVMVYLQNFQLCIRNCLDVNANITKCITKCSVEVAGSFKDFNSTIEAINTDSLKVLSLFSNSIFTHQCHRLRSRCWRNPRICQSWRWNYSWDVNFPNRLLRQMSLES